MEFVEEQEVYEVLQKYGVRQESVDDSDELVHLRMTGDEDVTQVLVRPDDGAASTDGAREVVVARDRIPAMVNDLIHALNFNQVVLIPVGKWQQVFDCVAFSLAENEAWTEVDAAATVELKRRDPLLFESADFHTLEALLRALAQDADEPGQGVMITTPTAPIIFEIVPDLALRIEVGNPVLADELLEVLQA